MGAFVIEQYDEFQGVELDWCEVFYFNLITRIELMYVCILEEKFIILFKFHELRGYQNGLK